MSKTSDKTMPTSRQVIPSHVVIIPDGNRRWARSRGLDSIEGHKKGLDTALSVVKGSRSLGVKVLTLWGFSTENWDRPSVEIKYLMRIYGRFFRNHMKELVSEGARFKWLGRRDRVPKQLKTILEKLEKDTARNTKYFLNICIDYGGHDEIVRAFRKLLKKGIKPSQITEDMVEAQLDTAGMPAPDLLIRTSGEMRTSGILPWQTAYTELFFSKLFFPDFSVAELKRAVTDFGRRQRRFGQ